ncbi:MAG: hypothetical protein JWP89_3596 [Schlesneria sp.]|nr:hypothetical protein [Schlesneria sp.]
MGLDNIKVIDAIGIEKNSHCAILSLFDSWDWDDDEPAHLLAIQDKFNSYLEFIENGQIFEDYPPARNKDLVIDVIFRFPPPSSAINLLTLASSVASELNVRVRHQTVPDANS